MQIVKAMPPNIEAIALVFPVKEALAKHDVWFCYAGKIYNPRGGKIPDAILAHERVHAVQQKLEHDARISLEHGAEAWWEKYLTDPTFRLAEEVAAHAAEFRWHAGRVDTSRLLKGFRSPREWHLQQIALRLCSPLYGKMVSLSEAKALILADRGL